MFVESKAYRQCRPDSRRASAGQVTAPLQRAVSALTVGAASGFFAIGDPILFQQRP